MSMGRYLCQLCYSIVHYGERHPCFFYKNDEQVYTVPPPKELKEVERKNEEPHGTQTGNFNHYNGNVFSEAQQNDNEESEDGNSSAIKIYERMSPTAHSKRKRNCSSRFSWESLRGIKKNNFGSKSLASTSTERVKNKSEKKKSKGHRKTTIVSAEPAQMDESSTIEMTTNRAVLGPVADAAAVSVAGPSGIQTQSSRTGEIKPFVCDACGKEFGLRCSLEKHRRIHTGERPFECSTCRKRFTQQGNLMTHLRTHSGEKPFACHICSKAFSQKGTLEIHLRTHLGEKPFDCHVCRKAFAQKGTLEIHLRTHSGEKPFDCHVCSKTFSRKETLQSHLRTHTGEKTFKCPFCDMYFAEQSRCTRHQRRKHGTNE